MQNAEGKGTSLQTTQRTMESPSDDQKLKTCKPVDYAKTKNNLATQLSSGRKQSYRKGFPKEARVCPVRTTADEKLRTKIYVEKRMARLRKETFPNMKVFDHGMNQRGPRKLPKGTTCVPLPRPENTAHTPVSPPKSTTSVPVSLRERAAGAPVSLLENALLSPRPLSENAPREPVSGNTARVPPPLSKHGSGAPVTAAVHKPANLFHSVNTYGELLRVKKVLNRGHLLAETVVKRLKVLEGLKAAEAATPNTANEAKNGTSNEGTVGCSDRTCVTEGPKDDSCAKDANELLVLRSEDVVPELGDLPTMNQLLTLPSTLTEATRMIFDLRRDMLKLRNALLRRALEKTEGEIQMRTKKTRPDKQQRLIKQLVKLFSGAQLAFWRDNGKSVPWGLEDYLHAISLRKLCSHNTYQYVTGTLKLPLPSMFSVRSMAACGLLPEVSERYQELAEIKHLNFDRRRSRKKRAQSPEGLADGTIAQPESTDTNRPVARARRGGGSGGISRSPIKRARTEDLIEPEAPPAILRRPCWGDLNQRVTVDQFASDAEQRSDSSGNESYVTMTSPLRNRVRGRGRGRGGRGRRQRGARSSPDPSWTRGKRGPWEGGQHAVHGDVSYSSDEEWSRTDVEDFSPPGASRHHETNRERYFPGAWSPREHWTVSRRSPEPGSGQSASLRKSKSKLGKDKLQKKHGKDKPKKKHVKEKSEKKRAKEKSKHKHVR
ncbi:uncharacterized protein LOC122374643 isoform X2 [Amphibalanus amphitrite]|uniref:uncharacterized protein LOC122374643 isoform X2 n=2 Tax=Amphibalanus amphitrite TaxID=1232801 RepID=UPI001C9116F4|nr:uncharacterized protein LOC122374643 isoform X2 [Amphibalanus amphitrite]